MRIINAILLVLFLGSLTALTSAEAFGALNPYRSRCVGIQGKFTANSTWDGGAIQVGCKGDDGLAVSDQSQRCTGEVLTVRPGQTYRLTKCSCFGSDKGCLKKGKKLKLEPLIDGKRRITIVQRIADMPTFIQNSCTVTKTANICGANGQHIAGNIKIRCQVPSPTPAPPSEVVSSTPTPVTSETPSPSISPPLKFCPVPEKVENVKITCPNCNVVSSTPTQQSN